MDPWGVPSDFIDDPEEWNEILDEICWAFWYVFRNRPSCVCDHIEVEAQKDRLTLNILNREKYEKCVIQDNINYWRCRNGLRLFAEYFENLWD